MASLLNVGLVDHRLSGQDIFEVPGNDNQQILKRTSGRCHRIPEAGLPFLEFDAEGNTGIHVFVVRNQPHVQESLCRTDKSVTRPAVLGIPDLLDSIEGLNHLNFNGTAQNGAEVNNPSVDKGPSGKGLTAEVWARPWGESLYWRELFCFSRFLSPGQGSVPLPLLDKLLPRKGSGMATLFAKLKSGMGLEHTGHRSPLNGFVPTLSCLVAYSLAQPKINIGTVPTSDHSLKLTFSSLF